MNQNDVTSEFFEMHARSHLSGDCPDLRDLVKGVTVRLPVQIRTQLDIVAEYSNLSRQEVLETLVTNGLPAAIHGIAKAANADDPDQQAANIIAEAKDLENQERSRWSDQEASA